MRYQAIYARQSIEKKNSLSIQGQQELCRRAAGTDQIWLYQDRGYSGKNTARPDFQRLLQDIRADRIQKLYVYRLDMNHENLRNTVISVLERAAELQVHPKFYNSLYRNCTTGLLPMLPGAVDLLSGDIRVILNGMAVQLLFEKDMIAHRAGESFGSIRARSLVPGLCCGKDAPAGRYAGESEARWLRER